MAPVPARGPIGNDRAVDLPSAGGGSELRWVSVLFVDLVGFTTWSETQDPEDVRELLSGYFALARTVVDRYGGTVEKFIGDAVMAVWGSPTAREDDAERAVRAALDLVAAVPALGEARRVPDLQARGGVVTGQVLSWANPGEGLVVGDRVNTAARVQSAAAPSVVLVDQTTRQVTQAAVDYTDAGRHMVAGKTEALHLWRAQRVVAGLGGAQRVQGLETAFHGRARELSVVKALFHASAEEGRARLVSVLGGAGVGKSRLGWEFEKYVDGLAVDIWWHRGRCLPYGDGVAFWALTEMVRQRFDIAENDPPQTASAKLAEGLPTWVPDEQERAFIMPRLAVLVGASTSDIGDAGDRRKATAPDAGQVDLSRQDLFAGWRLFLERLAESHPVVLLIENLQWADAGLLDFLEFLLDWSQDCALFIFTLSRPELTDTRPGWLASRRDSINLHLTPLPDAVMVDILGGLVPDIPASVQDRIIARAQGIPLYAVELIRSLLDRGIVTLTDGQPSIGDDVGELDVPGSLTSLITARLDALPADERALVKDLAVLGDSFPADSITAISTTPPEQVARILRSLVGKEVLTVRVDPLSPDRGQYTFVQTMLRTVAHGMLTKKERKSRHLAVARHLQANPNQGEDVAEVIATHYLTAYHAASSGERDELRDHTARALAAAGRHAGQIGAPDTAETHYRQAAALSATDQEMLLRYAGDMAYQAGRFTDAQALYEDAATAHLRAGRHREAAALAARIGKCQGQLGFGELGIARMTAALPILEAAGRDASLAETHAHLATALLFAGHGDQSAHHAEQAVRLAQELNLPDELGMGYLAQAFGLSDVGRIPEALAKFDAAIRVAKEHNHAKREMMARLNHAVVRLDFDLPGALEETETALAFARRQGDRDTEGLSLANLASIHLWFGNCQEADQLAALALRTLPEGGSAGARVAAHLTLVVLFAMRGQVAETRQEVATLISLGASDDIQDQAILLVATAMEAAAEAQPRKALDKAAEATSLAHGTFGLVNEYFRQAWPLAVELATTLGEHDQARDLLNRVSTAPPDTIPPYLSGQLHRCRALLASHTAARARDIETDLHAAIGIFSDLNYPYWHARTQLDLGEWLTRTGRAPEATAMLRDALATFQHLGAQPMTGRVQGLLRSARMNRLTTQEPPRPHLSA